MQNSIKLLLHARRQHPHLEEFVHLEISSTHSIIHVIFKEIFMEFLGFFFDPRKIGLYRKNRLHVVRKIPFGIRDVKRDRLRSFPEIYQKAAKFYVPIVKKTTRETSQ
jgi:hypothetical protein